MRNLLLAAIFFAGQVSVIPASACSAFAGGGAVTTQVMGKSYDWLLSHGIALINKRNVEKTALVPGLSNDPLAQWTSKYGSVTYTQFGREFPLSGMNEKGLAVEILWDYDNEGPSGKGPLPSINEAQWIQYQLDMSADVKEAIANAHKVKIKKVYADVHYMACDRSGACATFEFRKDQVVINEMGPNGLKVLTNSDYGRSADYAQDYVGFGGKKSIPYGSYDSKDRFVILGSGLEQLNSVVNSRDAVSLSFDMLMQVRNVNSSVWNIVHDMSANVSHFKKMFEKQKVMQTHLNRFDLSCRSPVQILDLESGLDGDVTALYQEYDPAMNRANIELTGKGLGIGKPLQEAAINYPSTTRCTEPN